MDVLIPPLPVYGVAKFKLFKHLESHYARVKSRSVATPTTTTSTTTTTTAAAAVAVLNYQAMAGAWNKRVDGVQIFPKLASHIRTFHTTKKKKLNRLATLELHEDEHRELLDVIEADVADSDHPPLAERCQPILLPKPRVSDEKSASPSFNQTNLPPQIHPSPPQSICLTPVNSRFPGAPEYPIHIAHWTAPAAEFVST